MKQGPFSILAFYRHFVMTCGARQMVVNPGHGCRPREARVEATRSGLPSIRPTARDTASNTSLGTLRPAAAAVSSAVPRTAGSLGRLRSLFLTGLTSERSTWTPTATCMSAAKDSAGSFVSARAMHSSEARRQLLTKAPPSTSAAA